MMILTEGQVDMWDELDEPGKQGLILKLLSQGMHVLAAMLIEYNGAATEGAVWTGEAE